MSLTLHCDCGHRLTLSDEEARELIWCPYCRKVLVRPRLYNPAEGNFATQQPPVAPAPIGGVNSRVLRLGFGLIVVLFMGILHLAFDESWHNEPSDTPPSFQLQPVDWDQLQKMQPLLDDPPPKMFDFESGLLPDRDGRPRLDDPLVPFRPGVDVFPGVRPGGPEHRPDDP